MVPKLSSFVKPLFTRSELIPLFPLPHVPLAEATSEHTQVCIFNQWFNTSIFQIPTFAISGQLSFSTWMPHRHLKVNMSKGNWFPLNLILTSTLSLLCTSSSTQPSGQDVLSDTSHFYPFNWSLRSVNCHSQVSLKCSLVSNITTLALGRWPEVVCITSLKSKSDLSAVYRIWSPISFPTFSLTVPFQTPLFWTCKQGCLVPQIPWPSLALLTLPVNPPLALVNYSSSNRMVLLFKVTSSRKTFLTSQEALARSFLMFLCQLSSYF